jgi:putative hemolysin
MFALAGRRSSLTTRTAAAAKTHIIDELLDERSDTLRRVPFLWFALRRWCLPLFRYHDAVDWADRLGPCGGLEALRAFGDHLRLRVDVRGLEHVPRRGPVLIVANHPTGVVDAIAIYEAIGSIRPDLCFFTNRDVVRIVPRAREFVIPVEWLKHKRTPERMRETLEATHAAFAEERAIVIFPAGGIARGTLGGIRDLPWRPTAMKLLRKWRPPVVPLHIRARNSMLYYALEQIHDEVRDLLRFREILGKRGVNFEVTLGPLLKPAALQGDVDDAIGRLQTYVERELSLSRGAAAD